MDAVVLTSENSAEFYARKLNLEPPAAPAKASEPVVESDEVKGDKPADEADDKQPNPDNPEKQQKINLRFSELTKQRDEAKAEADKRAAEARADREARDLAEKRAQEAEARLKAKENPKPAEKSDEVGPEPKPEQFTDAFEYAKALAEYSAEKALAERDKQEAEKKSIAEREKVAQAWIARQNAVKAEIPEYEAEIAKSTVVVSDQVRDAIVESEVGPKILLHLARNPDFGVKLAGLSANAALREIGKLEAKLEGSTVKEPAKDAPAHVASEPSRAPAPITPVRGTSAPAEPTVDSDGVFHGSYAQWKAQRKAGKIR